MASYTDLRSLYNNSELRNKVAVAIAIAANKVLTGVDNGAPFSQIAGAHDLRVIWARTVFGASSAHVGPFWERMLAANKSAPVGGITAADDDLIQTNVDQAVDLFAGVAV